MDGEKQASPAELKQALDPEAAGVGGMEILGEPLDIVLQDGGTGRIRVWSFWATDVAAVGPVEVSKEVRWCQGGDDEAQESQEYEVAYAHFVVFTTGGPVYVRQDATGDDPLEYVIGRLNRGRDALVRRVAEVRGL